MRMREFIKNNRQEIDEVIKNAGPSMRFNDTERELWVMNNEGLYSWAKSEGVKI